MKRDLQIIIDELVIAAVEQGVSLCNLDTRISAAYMEYESELEDREAGR